VLWNNCFGDVFKVECGVRCTPRRNFVSSTLCYLLHTLTNDELTKELRLAGFGVSVGAHYMGSMLYADDVALLAGSCSGLQKMLDICTQYGCKWDITFNPSKSQLLTLGGSNPPVRLTLADRPLVWCNNVKYLGVHLVSGKNFKIDVTSAKLKYHGCFNSILSVIGNSRMKLHV